MSAISAATSDESTTKIVSSTSTTSTTSSSYANIVQKDNDKEKSNVRSISASETAKKSNSAAAPATNVPSSNTKTDKSKVSISMFLSIEHLLFINNLCICTLLRNPSHKSQPQAVSLPPLPPPTLPPTAKTRKQMTRIRMKM